MSVGANLPASLLAESKIRPGYARQVVFALETHSDNLWANFVFAFVAISKVSERRKKGEPLDYPRDNHKVRPYLFSEDVSRP